MTNWDDSLKTPMVSPDDVKKSQDRTMRVFGENIDNETINAMAEESLTDLKEQLTDKEFRKQTVDLLNKMGSMLASSYSNSELSGIVNRENADWAQEVKSPKGAGLRIGAPPIKQANADAALARIQRSRGIGGSRMGYLYRSGLVVTIGGFTPAELSHLSALLSERQTEVGYASAGLVYSAGSFLIISEIVDFILEHVLACNVRGWSRGDTATLRKLIRISDIDALCAIALASAYNSGYPVANTCRNNLTNSCKREIPTIHTRNGISYRYDAMLDFRKTLLVDRSLLSERLLTFLTSGSHTEAEIVAEQNAIAEDLGDSYVDIEGREDNTRIVFEEPTFERYAMAGKIWFNDISTQITAYLSEVEDVDPTVVRNKRMARLAKILDLLHIQEYTAWAKEIIITPTSEDSEDPVETVTDIERVYKMFEFLTREDEEEQSLIKEIEHLRNATTISITAIPSFTCKACVDSGNAVEDDADSEIVPIPMYLYFFSIAGLV